MRIISTMMLSKQTQSNCSLRTTVPLQERQSALGRRTEDFQGQESYKPRTRSHSWVETPRHPPGFNYAPALELSFPKFGLTDHLFADLKTSYSRLMNTQSLQFSLTPRKPQSGNRCLRYWDFLQHCIIQCLPKPWQKPSQSRVLRRDYFSSAGQSGVPGVLVASR